MDARLAVVTAALLGLSSGPCPDVAPRADQPVEGRYLILKGPAVGQPPSLDFLGSDAGLGPVRADPSYGAWLVVHASNAPGQCHAEVELDPAHWTPVVAQGGKGYRYADPAGTRGGVREVVIQPGRFEVHASGPDWPCDVGAAQQLPVTVELRFAGFGNGRRWCAGFGGDVLDNEPGRLHARLAPAPDACLDRDLTVANLNVLHGTACVFVPGSPENFCRLPERIDLLFDWVAASGCPDVVTLQEVAEVAGALDAPALIESHLATTCPFPYEAVLLQNSLLDDQMILSRYPVLDSELRVLHRQFRSATWARIDHPLGPVDVVTTHLASGSDSGSFPCDAFGPCPPECLAAGTPTMRSCQAEQTALFLEEKHDGAAPAVVTGDFNEEPDGDTWTVFAGRGWVDSYRAAGNPPCDGGVAGVGCTSGREDQDLSQLEAPASHEDRRIDYAFLVAPGAGSACLPAFDPASDADGDLSATRIFADEPNPFVAACGPLPDAICWPSDHEGSEVDLNCF